MRHWGMARTLALHTTSHIHHAHKVEPIVNMGTGNTVGYEVLHPGPMPRTISEWRTWYRRILNAPADTDVWTAINFDTRHLLDDTIVNLLYMNSRSTQRVIEWTEFSRSTHRQGDLAAAARILTDLRSATGTRLSIDDAGAGIDAVQRMSLAPPDFVKIDGHLFQQSETCRHTRKLLRGLLALSRDVGAEPIIEWIETEAQHNLAKHCGARLGQGFYFMEGHGVVTTS